MPVEKESRVTQAIMIVREWIPTVRPRVEAWVEACRAEPVLIWHTPAVRCGVYLLLALIAIFCVTFFIGLFAPGGPEPIPQAETADFHVVCSDPECGAHFVIKREFEFRDFPVPCPKCDKLTGLWALRCSSEECRGRWVIPQIVGEQRKCPHCGQLLGEAP